LRKLILWSFGFLSIGVALIGFEKGGTMPLFVSLIPAFLAFAICYLLHMCEQANMEKSVRIGATVAFLSVICYPLAANLLQNPAQPKVAGRSGAEALKDSSKPTDACLTDQPWTVAWYGQRRAVWLPVTINTTKKVRENVKGMNWLLLTSDSRAYSSD